MKTLESLARQAKWDENNQRLMLIEKKAASQREESKEELKLMEGLLKGNFQQIAFFEESKCPLNAKQITYDIQQHIIQTDGSRVVLAKDISDKKLAEQQQKLSEIMIASTSHDMRTPLNTIVSMHELLNKRIGDSSSGEVKEWLKIAQNSTCLLQYLVNDALDFFQIKQGKFIQRRENFKLENIAREAFDLIQIQMEQKKLAWEIDVEESLTTIQVRFDKQRLSQVLINLLSNALKFTFNGKIKLSMKVSQSHLSVDSIRQVQSLSRVEQEALLTDSISHSEDGISGSIQQGKKPLPTVKVEISVTDSGIGINPEEKCKLFKLFGKVGGQVSEQLNPQGIGLGLTICNRILCQYGSKLEVESELGKGSRFFFSISFPYLDLEQGHLTDSIGSVITTTNLKESIMTDVDDEVIETAMNMNISCFPQQIMPHGSVDSDFIHQRSPLIGVVPLQRSLEVAPLNLKLNYAKPQNQPARKRCGCKQVLIVDDNNFNVYSLSCILKSRFGIDADESYNGQQAVEKVSQRSERKCPCGIGKYDLIFMDVEMPLINGYQATKIIRKQELERPCDSPFIVGLTAHEGIEHEQACIEAGMNGFMSKPIQIEELRRTLQQCNIL